MLNALSAVYFFMIRRYFLRVDDKLLLNQIIKIRELQWNRVRAVYDELK